MLFLNIFTSQGGLVRILSSESQRGVIFSNANSMARGGYLALNVESGEEVQILTILCQNNIHNYIRFAYSKASAKELGLI